MIKNNIAIRGAWVCISKNPKTTVRADDGYLETVGESYEWVAKLPFGRDLEIGDVIILRDDQNVLGFSLIEDIEISQKPREQTLCPKCGIAQVRERKKKVPRYMCANCQSEFHNPVIETTILEHRRAIYGAGWVSLEPDFRTEKAWRFLSESPMSQHSMQRVDLAAFTKFKDQYSKLDIAQFECRDPHLRGGHKLRTVKTRIGQSAFRANLLSQFGSNCAITGRNHPYGLEAAHLYSYSEHGKHHADGGLLLRRDIHHLFDKGLIAINPSTGRVNEHSELLDIEQYRVLDGLQLNVKMSAGIQNWLQLHWQQFRS